MFSCDLKSRRIVTSWVYLFCSPAHDYGRSERKEDMKEEEEEEEDCCGCARSQSVRHLIYVGRPDHIYYRKQHTQRNAQNITV